MGKVIYGVDRLRKSIVSLKLTGVITWRKRVNMFTYNKRRNMLCLSCFLFVNFQLSYDWWSFSKKFEIIFIIWIFTYCIDLLKKSIRFSDSWCFFDFSKLYILWLFQILHLALQDILFHKSLVIFPNIHSEPINFFLWLIEYGAHD